MFSCCECFSRRWDCVANRKLDEVFESETTPLDPHISLIKPLPVDPHAITSLLYNFLLRELHSKGVRHRCETYYLGSDLDDATFCSLCHKSLASQTHMQFEMNNRFFGNVWLGNLYILQFVCVPCSKRIQPKLIETLDAVQNAYRTIQAMLLKRKLQTLGHLSSDQSRAITSKIVSFLPRSFLSLKIITYHRPSKTFFSKSSQKHNPLLKSGRTEDDLSIWVGEQIIR